MTRREFLLIVVLSGGWQDSALVFDEKPPTAAG
jgi:hypothetical protein